MKFSGWSAFALLACACASNAGINNWSERGPHGGIVVDVAFDPSNSDVVYAAGAYALFKSADGGVNWTELPQDLGTYPRRDVTVDPSNPSRVYAASMGGGVFRSTDGGASFTRISPMPTDANVDGPVTFALSNDGNALYYSTNSGQFFRSTDAGARFTAATSTSPLIHWLVIDPANNQTLYAAAGTQLLKTIDGGSTWVPLTSPAPGLRISSVAFVPATPGAPGTPATVWVSTPTNVFSTEDEGTSWTPAAPSLGARVLFQDVSSPSTLYASQAFDGGNVRRLLGSTWLTLAGPLPAGVNNVVTAPGNSQVIIAATASGLYRSINGGNSWTRSDSGITGVRAEVLTSTAGSVFSGSEHGEIGIGQGDSLLRREVVRSTIAQPLRRTQVSSIAVRPSDPDFIITGFASAGYQYSTDGGDNWNNGSPALNDAWMDAIAIDPSNESIVYAAVRASGPPPLDRLWRSADGGRTFSPLASDVGVIWTKKMVVDPDTPARLFLMSSRALNAGDVTGLLRSNDSGATWNRIQDFIGDFVLDPTDSRRIYAANGAAFFVSEDSGDTFENIHTFHAAPGGYQTVLSITADPAAPGVLYASAVSYTGPFTAPIAEYFVMRSVDGGRTWERIPNRVQQNWLPWKIEVNSAQPTILVAATAATGVYSFQIAPDIGTSIVGHESPKAIGVPTFYEVRAQNNGPFAATSVVFASTFPVGAQNVSASIPNGTCTVGATSAQCVLPTLLTNAVASARVSYTPPAAAELAVQASVNAREADPVASNNSATASASAMETIDLAVTGTATPSTPDRGGSVAYTFTVRNRGPNASSLTRLTIAAGAGLTVTTASPSTCTVSGGAVTCEFGALANDATVTATVNATTSAAGTLRMTATVARASSAADLDASNDVAIVDVVSREPPANPNPGGGNTGGGGGGGGSLSIDLLIILAMIAMMSAHTRRARRHPFNAGT